MRAGDVVSGVGIVVMDVTERRAAERALRAQTDRYEALLVALSDAGEGLVVLERDGRCVFANSAFEQLCGYTFPELAAMESALDLVVEYEQEEVRRRAAARLDQGLVQPALPLTLRRRDGGLADVEVGGVRLDVEDRRQLVVVVRDVSARRRAEAERERLLAAAALLAEASELFDQSLDEYGDARQRRAAVRARAGRDVRDPARRGAGERAACRRRRARAGPRGRAAARCWSDSDEHPMDTVMRTGDGVVAGRRAWWFRCWPAAACTACSPRASTARRSDDDVLLFEDLGRRAALALDSARLYAERDHVARTLQSSLLPRELPEIPGIELAARYLAAGEGNEVGGDFYDCFADRRGDWALVIGDVCGKGAEAAALTALARYTVRAAALQTAQPERGARPAQRRAAARPSRLPLLHGALRLADAARRTACPRALAAGGHPLPLVLRAGGAVETAGAPGSLLGIVDRAGAGRAAARAGARRRARALHRRRHRGRPARPGPSGSSPCSRSGRAPAPRTSPRRSSATRWPPPAALRATTWRWSSPASAPAPAAPFAGRDRGVATAT